MAARERLPYFPFYPADFLSDPMQAGMTPAEAGLYIRLLALMWKHNQSRTEWEPLPGDDGTMRRITGASYKQWQRFCERVVNDPGGPIRRTERGLTNARIEAEFVKSITVSQGRSRGGRNRAKTLQESISPEDDQLTLSGQLNSGSPESETETEIEREVPPLDPAFIAKLWNTSATVSGLPTISVVTESRRRKIRARAKLLPTEGDWAAHFTKIAASAFCRGDNDRGWRASFDWAIRSEDVVVKVQEGVYSSRTTPQPNDEGWTP